MGRDDEIRHIDLHLRRREDSLGNHRKLRRGRQACTASMIRAAFPTTQPGLGNRAARSLDVLRRVIVGKSDTYTRITPG